MENIYESPTSCALKSSVRVRRKKRSSIKLPSKS